MLLIIVLHYFGAYEVKLYVCLAEHLFAFLPTVIFFQTHHSFYSAVYNHHCTCSARCHGTIKSCSFQCYSSFCRLAYSVLFCMDGSHAMGTYFAFGVNIFFE